MTFIRHRWFDPSRQATGAGWLWPAITRSFIGIVDNIALAVIVVDQTVLDMGELLGMTQ
jgi:hypothetical protein